MSKGWIVVMRKYRFRDGSWFEVYEVSRETPKLWHVDLEYGFVSYSKADGRVSRLFATRLEADGRMVALEVLYGGEMSLQKKLVAQAQAAFRRQEDLCSKDLKA